MKKYQQLALVIVSFISLTLFLVYRHEYNRLHYILEVFNFFGTPCNFSEFKKSEKLLDHYDWGQIPLWQENDNFYTYSGFVNKSVAQVISIENIKAKSPKKCFLWFNDNQESISGHMNSYEFARNDEFKACIYKCTLRSSSSVPYAVSFSSKPNYLYGKVLLTELESRPISIRLTVCVPPRNFNKRELIEFISFHKLIGIKYFLFYHNDIPYDLTKYLRNLAEILGIEAAFIPWNFPKYSNEITKDIVEKDCKLRTSKNSKSYIVLDMNEYLVPSDSYTIHPLFQTSRNMKSINIPIQKFCISSIDSFSPIAIQNTKRMDDGELLVKRLIFHNEHGKKKKNENHFQMAIFSYSHCPSYSGRTTIDKTMSKYSTDLIRSTLVQLLIHKQII